MKKKKIKKLGGLHLKETMDKFNLGGSSYGQQLAIVLTVVDMLHKIDEIIEKLNE